jgi:hypothetical protein
MIVLLTIGIFHTHAVETHVSIQPIHMEMVDNGLVDTCMANKNGHGYYPFVQIVMALLLSVHIFGTLYIDRKVQC